LSVTRMMASWRRSLLPRPWERAMILRPIR
jgi:hypothetical protein